ncbi:hypothetical protein C8A01DRAFT_42223 [Parachaetomium inaequale]|uniref:Uncharacterized protein n=1 Tax=Parachaetomium inaequale TaxID=2588326 RepID=A0AAN6P6H3_9PEZI|nr:hypothetical protein C8A01DRAFT_42223 [Parachaetomium inaequale]
MSEQAKVSTLLPTITTRRILRSPCDFYALAIDALGPSLEDLLNYYGRKFSLKTILLIAD